MSCILEVKNLSTHFDTLYGPVRAVDGVDFVVNAGDTMGIVGESGCGKTVLALSIIRLIPTPAGKIHSGSVIFNNKDLLSLKEEDMRMIRGKEISMIFQEPMNSLNPVLSIGEQIAEVIRLHQNLSRKISMDRTVEMLKIVGIPSPQKRISDYPHQMSGGMRQRVMIAMALACTPKLMLADEPTTALDVTVQAQIIDLINKMKDNMGTSVIMITHDLGVIAGSAQYIAVMYAGKFVEYGPVSDVFLSPLHPYTIGLLESIPKILFKPGNDGYQKIMPGTVPSLNNLPEGCCFRDRCTEVMDICGKQQPDMFKKSIFHTVRCWKYT